MARPPSTHQPINRDHPAVLIGCRTQRPHVSRSVNIAPPTAGRGIECLCERTIESSVDTYHAATIVTKWKGSGTLFRGAKSTSTSRRRTYRSIWKQLLEVLSPKKQGTLTKFERAQVATTKGR